VDSGLKISEARIIAGNREIAQIHLDSTETPYPYALMIPQSETERLMERHLNHCGVPVERQVELLRFEPGPDTVSVTLRHADGREEDLQPAWLIGCDGAHSTVRHGLRLEFEGDTLPSDWMLADVHLTGVKSSAKTIDIFWHSDGTLVLFPITGERYRVIADFGTAQADAHPGAPTLQDVQTVLDRRGPGGITVSDPIWLASFRINERKVTDYRVGRVFLAGDAAHVHSPAGGQGMNTGMQDACNLAWKLAMVCRGVAGPEPLLDSYNIERGAVGRQVIADTGRLTTLAILRGGILQEIRNHAASLLFGLAPVGKLVANKLMELSIGYPDGPLTAPGRHGRQGPAPGERMPVTDVNPPVGAGDAPRFALFARGDDAGAQMLARHRDVLEPMFREPPGGQGIWLVRPDGYVAAVARAGNWAEIDQYLERTLGPTRG
jgi:2-polyprenyl-6-methoxyphenol hydroxylase-like FAD-dependent oxidoreductase